MALGAVPSVIASNPQLYNRRQVIQDNLDYIRNRSLAGLGSPAVLGNSPLEQLPFIPAGLAFTPSLLTPTTFNFLIANTIVLNQILLEDGGFFSSSISSQLSPFRDFSLINANTLLLGKFIDIVA